VCALLRSRTPEQLFRESRIAADRGYTTFKLKVGGDAIENDAANLAAVRNAVGDDPRIRLDANRAWNLDDAAAALARFSTHAIEFIEEPLRDPTPTALAKLRAESGVPLALDESIATAKQLGEFLDPRCADFIVFKAARVGGASRCVELARTASVSGLTPVITDSLESAIGMSLAVHLAAAVSAGVAAGLAGARFLSDAGDIPAHFREPVELEPCGPGLDVALPAESSTR
jgi:o-succinylbenzoate synthase